MTIKHALVCRVVGIFSCQNVVSLAVVVSFLLSSGTAQAQLNSVLVNRTKQDSARVAANTATLTDGLPSTVQKNRPRLRRGVERTAPLSEAVRTDLMKQKAAAEQVNYQEELDLLSEPEYLPSQTAYHQEPLFDNSAWGHCGPRRRPWFKADYLLWSVEGFSVPALVTTSDQGTVRADAGVLGLATTSVLVGNQELVDGDRNGGRFEFGYWIDPCQRMALQVVYFTLDNESDTFGFESAGGANDPILARPFFNVEPGLVGEDAELAAFPAELSGGIRVEATTEMENVEVMLRRVVLQNACHRTNLLFGWRHMSLDDTLRIDDNRTVLDGMGALVDGTTVVETDLFQTNNEFNGFQFGAHHEYRCRRWSLDALVKVAVGETSAQSSISGSTVVTVPVPNAPDDVSTRNTGLLTQNSNIGTRTEDELAVVPELGITLGYNMSPRLRATLGYSFIYWSQVMRPGDVIDTDLNLSQQNVLNGAARPRYQPRFTDVWAQGINLGVHYNY